MELDEENNVFLHKYFSIIITKKNNEDTNRETYLWASLKSKHQVKDTATSNHRKIFDNGQQTK